MQLLGDRYFRINPILPDKIPLDAWKRVPELVRIAQAENLELLKEWLGEKWK